MVTKVTTVLPAEVIALAASVESSGRPSRTRAAVQARAAVSAAAKLDRDEALTDAECALLERYQPEPVVSDEIAEGNDEPDPLDGVQTCECGCGTPVLRRFVRGHASQMRGKANKAAKEAARVACACGCGGLANVGRRFLPGHDSKLRSQELAAERAAQPARTCECGCGTVVQRRFARGHAGQMRGAALRAAREAARVQCGCGCGERPSVGRGFLRGHASKLRAKAA